MRRKDEKLPVEKSAGRSAKYTGLQVVKNFPEKDPKKPSKMRRFFERGRGQRVYLYRHFKVVS